MGDDLGGLLAPDGRDFDGWYAVVAPRLVASLTLVCGDPERAADAAAEAFTRALERWRRVSAMDAPEAWVHRVAVNVLRRQARRRSLEARYAPRWVERDPSMLEVAPEVWAAIAALPERQRHAIALRYVLGCNQREVAEAMGVSEGTAASTLSHARRRLAELLADGEDELTELRP